MLLIKLKQLSMGKPILKNLCANFSGIGINLFCQVILVPFYIEQWGVDKYADWIVLSSVSSVFSMSDIGLNTVISNQFSIKMAQGDEQYCRSLLTDNYFLLLIVSLFGIIGCLVFVNICDVNSLLGLSVLSSKTTRVVLLLLVIQIFVSMIGGVSNAVYRSKSLTFRSIYIDNLAKLVEGFILLSGLLLHCRLELLAFFYVIPNIYVMVYKYYDIKKIYSFVFQINNIDIKLLKGLLFPSFSFMLFPVGNLIIQQGFTLFVNKYFGASSLVLYNTTRTLCNFIKTIMNSINYSVWPELSIAYGKHDYVKMKRIYYSSLFLSVALSILISIFLLIAGPFIYVVWTNNEIEFDFSLMFAFLLVLFFNNFWFTGSVVLAATNKHSVLSILFVLGSCLSLLMAYIINLYFHSLIYITYSLVVIDMILSMYTIKTNRCLLRLNSHI
jgi:hypothetical protein